MERLSKCINKKNSKMVHLKKIIGEFQNEGIGHSCGGLTSKIHCLSDQFGNPVDLVLTGGQVHDSQCAEFLPDNKKPIL